MLTACGVYHEQFIPARRRIVFGSHQLRRRAAVLFPRPGTIFQLTVIGFLTVTAPLIIALVVMTRQVDLLGERSERAVSQAAGAMRASSELVEQTLAMERNARQYAVLGDGELLDLYLDRRADFRAAAQTLQDLRLSDELGALAARAVAGEKAAYDALVAADLETAAMEQALSAYGPILDLANETAFAVNTWLDRELVAQRTRVARTQQMSVVIAAIVIVAALVLAGLFTALITRPLRGIDRAIHQLGSGRLKEPIAVQGPRDLQELGSRLDWLRHRLSELEQQRVTFMRNVSHELKTPLAAIHEGVAVLRDGLVGVMTREQSEIITILGNQCRRLQRQIEELLRLNTSGAAEHGSEPAMIELDRLVNGVITEHELALNSGAVHVDRRLARVAVHGNVDQIRVVVDNLLSNAIKYSPPGETIRVQLEAQSDAAVLEVRDSGPGIHGAERTRVFEAFYRGRPPEKRHLPGTGLGLAIARDFARMNGGDIEVLESTAGARFQVRLPLKQEERQ